MRLTPTYLQSALTWALLLFGLSFVTACSNLKASTVEMDSIDPMEKVNRPIYKANDFLDRHIAEPVARKYIDYTPDPIRHSVSNFFDNVTYLNVILNDFLQGKGKQGLDDSLRFLVNTTFGLLGIWDHATPLGLEKHNEDFGQTLGHWGVGEGSYLVLPVLGPNTVRDTPDLGVSAVTNILFYVTNPVVVPVALLGFIDKRSRFDEAIQFRNETAVEPYLFTREAYLQHRKFLIYDGNPPVEDDLFLEKSFAEVEDEKLSGSRESTDAPKEATPHFPPKSEPSQLDQSGSPQMLKADEQPAAAIPVIFSIR